MIKNKKILITGGCGFLGSNLILRLLDKNKITVYDNKRRDALRFFCAKSSNLKIVIGDILDKKALAKVVIDHDIIIHLAAMAGVGDYYAHPVKTMQVNMIGTANLLEVLEKQKYERFVYFSTSEVYGAHAEKAKEDAHTMQGNTKEARWTYSVSKLAGEHLCFAYHKAHNAPIVSIRPFNIYGPGQIGEGGIQTFTPLAIRNQPLKVTGDGLQTRAWCYIEDFIDGVCAALTTKGIEGESFNIGHPDGITILELAQKIIKLSDSQSQIEFIPHPGVDVLQRTPNIDKARKYLGYQPKVTLDEGLKKTVDWYRKHIKVFSL